MDKHNKISVRINGEDTYLERDHEGKEKKVKAQKVKDELFVAKEEQASAIEEWMEEQEKKKQTGEDEDEEEIPVIERSYPSKKRSFSLPSEMKQLLIAAASAILVGTVIGFIMIRIFGGIDGTADNAQPAMPALQTGTAQNGEGTAAGGTAQAVAFPDVSAFVVQAGIFSTEEKAKTWSQNLSDKGLEGFIWPRDGQFYLFAGVASSKENGEKIATYLKDQGFETFVKEWHVASGERKVAQAEGKWIQSGMESWKGILPITTALMDTGGGAISDVTSKVKAWKQAIPNEASERTAPIQEGFNQFGKAAETFQQNKSTQGLWNMQTSMLSIWYAYEQYMK